MNNEFNEPSEEVRRVAEKLACFEEIYRPLPLRLGVLNDV